MFGDAMSIFARNTCAPSGKSPARSRRRRAPANACCGLCLDGGCVGVPRVTRMSFRFLYARELPNERGTGFPVRAPSTCPDIRGFHPRSGCRHRPCRPGPVARRTGRGARNSPTRRRGGRPTKNPATGRLPGLTGRTRRLRSPGWCRQNGGCTCRRSRARPRNSGRSIWRARGAGIRWAPEGIVWPPGLRGGGWSDRRRQFRE